MNSNTISNDLMLFRSTITDLKNSNGQLKRCNQQLFDTFDTLNSSWVGSAHDSYVQNVNSDRDFMEKVLTTLAQFLQDMDEADAIYRKCESDVEDVITSIQV